MFQRKPGCPGCLFRLQAFRGQECPRYTNSRAIPEVNGVELLIVEDNEEDLQLALRSFKKANLTNRIQIARDGEEALDYIFCRGAFASRHIEDVPRVILLDLKLPKVGGNEVLQQIKADPRTRAIPVVILTSSKEQRDIDESYHGGANSYIVKPVIFDNFVKAMHELGMYWLLLNQPIK